MGDTVEVRGSLPTEEQVQTDPDWVCLAGDDTVAMWQWCDRFIRFSNDNVYAHFSPYCYEEARAAFKTLYGKHHNVAIASLNNLC